MVTFDIATVIVPSHDAVVPCAWRGQRVGIEAVVIAKVGSYHSLCWERRSWVVERA